MPLFHVALLAALRGLTEALPVSCSGHQVLAGIWLDESAPGAALEPVLDLGTALGLLAVARRRLAGALGEGVRAVSRPTLFRGSSAAHDAAVLAIGTVVSLITGALVTPSVEMWSASPTATGVGLCVTGLALASTAMIPRGGAPLRAAGPSFIGGDGAVLVGVALGLAMFPRASRVGAALTLLLWMGVKPDRAVDLAYLLAVPALLVAFARGAAGRAGGAGWAGRDATGLHAGTVALGLVLAFVGVAMASEVLRSLAARRRVGVLALWTIPAGLAMLAYARALPLPS
jgi:undecaprenyl-diphosphatase